MTRAAKVWQVLPDFKIALVAGTSEKAPFATVTVGTSSMQIPAEKFGDLVSAVQVAQDRLGTLRAEFLSLILGGYSSTELRQELKNRERLEAIAEEPCPEVRIFTADD